MTTNDLERSLAQASEALERAWGIIANAGMNIRIGPVVFTLPDGEEIRESGWCRESEEWVEAAICWRDEYFHPWLDSIEPPTLEEEMM